MHLQQLNITIAYQNGELKENVLMEIPKYTAEILRWIIKSSSMNDDIKKRPERSSAKSIKETRFASWRKPSGQRQAGRCWNDKIN